MQSRIGGLKHFRVNIVKKRFSSELLDTQDDYIHKY